MTGLTSDPLLIARERYIDLLIRTVSNTIYGDGSILPGFDPEFVDFPHYIIRITERIWHDRAV
ncbi:MAG: hypothetical protein MUE84_03185, partial [Hyphomonas sp.]|nr:hypothetical protein [Hyphomonas sp.]